MKWEGAYPGTRTIDIEKAEMDLDSWISFKVVEKMLKPLKVSTKEGSPCLLKSDSYGIIDKILKNEKLVKKILRKFSIVSPDLPSNKESLDNFLRKELNKNNSKDPEIVLTL